MKHVLGYPVTFSYGGVLMVCALLMRGSHVPPSAIDDRGAVAVHGPVRITQKEIGKYVLSFEGQTNLTETEKRHGVRVMLMADLLHMVGRPESGEMFFEGPTGTVDSDLKERTDAP